MEKKNREIAFTKPDISEREIEEVIKVLRSGWITTGPKTKEFERRIAEFTGTTQCVCLNSATACMETILHILGIGPGDEVITSAYTYSATASVICHVGATPVLIDTKPNSYEMDYEAMSTAITERTKAIIPVDIAGVLCDYEEIYRIVEEKKALFRATNEIQNTINRVIICSDCAHGFGAKREGLQAGLLADFTAFSFHAVKNLTTAEGGAFVWNSKLGLPEEDIYKKAMLLSLHGQTKDALNKNLKGAWEYDIVAPYYKCNMTDIQAAMGMAQLERYEEILQRRKALILAYDNYLRNEKISVLQHYTKGNESSGHLYMIRLLGKNRDETNEVINEMAKRGISTNVHYKPLPLLTAYKNMGFVIENFPQAYKMFENEITLPLYNQMTEEDVKYVTDNLLNRL